MNRRDFIKQGGMAALTALSVRPLLGMGQDRTPLVVAQIGTAHMHAPEKWQTLHRRRDLFDCIGLWEPDPAQRKVAEGKPAFAGAHWLTEAELFGNPRVQAVLVEAELPDLLALGRRCLEAGWHLHLDKPPGTDLPAFAALQTLAQQKKLTLQLGYMYRYHPAVQFCYKAVREGWLGEIFSVQGDIGKDIAPGRRAWLAQHYGGSMMLLGCHLLDLTVALLGAPEHVTPFRRRTLPQHDAYFDNEMAVLEYPRALATIRSQLTEVEGEERRQFVVCGDKGTVEILPLEPAQVRLALKHPAGGFEVGYQDVPLPAVTGRYDDLLEDFCRIVAGAPSSLPQFTPAHDLLVHRLLLQAGRT